MFGITTFMFVLGIIAQVMRTGYRFQVMQLRLGLTDGGKWLSFRIFFVEATITRLVVRLQDTSVLSA